MALIFNIQFLISVIIVLVAAAGTTSSPCLDMLTNTLFHDETELSHGHVNHGGEAIQRRLDTALTCLQQQDEHGRTSILQTFVQQANEFRAQLHGASASATSSSVSSSSSATRRVTIADAAREFAGWSLVASEHCLLSSSSSGGGVSTSTCIALQQQARHFFHIAYEANPTDTLVCHNYGIVLRSLGDEDSARQLFFAAIAANSSDPGPYIEIGQYYRSRGDKGPEAIEMSLRGMNTPRLSPSSQNEYALLTNVLPTIMTANEAPPDLVKQVLGHPALRRASRIYPHLALFMSHVKGSGGLWQDDDEDEGRLDVTDGMNDRLLQSLGFAQLLFLAGGAPFQTRRMLVLDMAVEGEAKKKNTTTTRDVDDVDASSSASTSFFPFIAAPDDLAEAVATWLRIDTAATPASTSDNDTLLAPSSSAVAAAADYFRRNSISLIDVAESLLAHGNQGMFIADSFLHSTTFEISYTDLPQWMMSYCGALALAMRQTMTSKTYFPPLKGSSSSSSSWTKGEFQARIVAELNSLPRSASVLSSLSETRLPVQISPVNGDDAGVTSWFRKRRQVAAAARDEADGGNISTSAVTSRTTKATLSIRTTTASVSSTLTQQSSTTNPTTNASVPTSTSTASPPSFSAEQTISRVSPLPPRLRLAYISPDLRRHAIGFMVLGTFASHNRSRVHVTAYHTKEIGNVFGLKGLLAMPALIRASMPSSSVAFLREETIQSRIQQHMKSTPKRNEDQSKEDGNRTKRSYCSRNNRGSDSSLSLSSPDWSDSIVEPFLTSSTFATNKRSDSHSSNSDSNHAAHFKLQGGKQLDWSAWARGYTSDSIVHQQYLLDDDSSDEGSDRSGGDNGNFSSSTGSFLSSFTGDVASVFCKKELWTHTSRIAAVTDMMYTSLFWKEESGTDQTSTTTPTASSSSSTSISSSIPSTATLVAHVSDTTKPHILIDLGGPTLGNTGAVCRARPAILTAHYLSGPVSVGTRADADFALVDRIVLAPDNAFHIPSGPEAKVLFGMTTGVGKVGRQQQHPITSAQQQQQQQQQSAFPFSAPSMAKALASIAPSIVSLRHVKRRQHNGKSNINNNNNMTSLFTTTTLVPIPVLRDFTESLVYLPIPFQANTLPTYGAALKYFASMTVKQRRLDERQQPQQETNTNNSDAACVSSSSSVSLLPEPCAALIRPILGDFDARKKAHSHQSGMQKVPATSKQNVDDENEEDMEDDFQPHNPSVQLCPDRANKTVFGALHSSVKVTAAAFASWMNILRRVPTSELWVLQPGGGPKASLRRRETLWQEAAARGVHPHRIVFVTESPRESFWYLFPCVDVFLDTWTYGAHSTGADALRFGVPVVTLDRGTFASRVVSSLLTGIGKKRKNKKKKQNTTSIVDGTQGNDLMTDKSSNLIASRVMISYSGMEYENIVWRLSGDTTRSSGRKKKGVQLARHLKIRLQPLVGGPTATTTRRSTRSSTNITGTSASTSIDDDSPPSPFDYADQAKKLEQAYRCMWEVRSIAGGGFPASSLTIESANSLLLPHIIVDPEAG